MLLPACLSTNTESQSLLWRESVLSLTCSSHPQGHIIETELLCSPLPIFCCFSNLNFVYLVAIVCCVNNAREAIPGAVAHIFNPKTEDLYDFEVTPVNIASSRPVKALQIVSKEKSETNRSKKKKKFICAECDVFNNFS